MSRASRRQEWQAMGQAWERLGRLDARRIRNVLALVCGGAGVVVAGLGIAGKL